MEKTSQSRDKFIDINGLSLHHLEWGSSDAIPMLLVHGLCSHAHYWDFFASRMKQDYYVVTLDQRGHGDSSWAKSYRPNDYVLGLEAFIARLAFSSMILIGHLGWLKLEVK